MFRLGYFELILIAAILFALVSVPVIVVVVRFFLLRSKESKGESARVDNEYR